MSAEVKESRSMLRRTAGGPPGSTASAGSSKTDRSDSGGGADLIRPSEKGGWRSVSTVTMQPKSALRSLFNKLQKRNLGGSSRGTDTLMLSHLSPSEAYVRMHALM